MSIIGNPIIVGKKPEQTKTVSPTTSQQIVTPDSGKVLSSVTVNAAPLQAKTVTPTKAGFSVSPDSGNYGLSSVKVNGDTNLVAANIKSGVKIFGVTGTYNPVTSAIIISGLGSTDTVTCSGGGKSYSATWISTVSHWEIVGLPLGTFTVTATNGTKTTTKTVLIDVAGIYDVEMDFRTYLYNNGNECTDLTGGWVTSGYTRNNYTTVSGIKEDDCIRVGNHTANMNLSYVGTLNTVNLSNYSTLCIEYTNNASDTYNPKFTILVSKNYSGDGVELYGNSNFVVTSEKKKAQMDLSSITGNYYVIWCSDAPNTIARAYKIWLE